MYPYLWFQKIYVPIYAEKAWRPSTRTLAPCPWLVWIDTIYLRNWRVWMQTESRLSTAWFGFSIICLWFFLRYFWNDLRSTVSMLSLWLPVFAWLKFSDIKLSLYQVIIYFKMNMILFTYLLHVFVYQCLFIKHSHFYRCFESNLWTHLYPIPSCSRHIIHCQSETVNRMAGGQFPFFL